MTSTPTEWLSLDAAATRLGCSSRTIQRRIAAGELPSVNRDGRTVVEVPRQVAAEQTLERLAQQSDDTARVAALAAVTADRAVEAYQHQVAAVTESLQAARRSVGAWRLVACVGMSVAALAAVAASWSVADAVATKRHLSDALAAVEGAEGRETLLLSMLSRVTASDTSADRIASAKAPPTDECVD